MAYCLVGFRLLVIPIASDELVSGYRKTDLSDDFLMVLIQGSLLSWLSGSSSATAECRTSINRPTSHRDSLRTRLDKKIERLADQKVI